MRRGSFIPGLILIVIGGWFLASNLGVRLPDLSALWPAFPLIGGLAAILDHFRGGRRDSGKIFVGVAAAGVGAFFFLFTLGRLEWAQMGDYWPVFVLIGSAAFFAQWLADPARRGLLVPAAIALAVGLIFLPETRRFLNPAVTEQLIQFWPLALIVIGLLILAGNFRRSRVP